MVLYLRVVVRGTGILPVQCHILSAIAQELEKLTVRVLESVRMDTSVEIRVRVYSLIVGLITYVSLLGRRWNTYYKQNPQHAVGFYKVKR